MPQAAEPAGDDRWERLAEDLSSSAGDDLDEELSADLAAAHAAEVTLAARLHASKAVSLHVPPALVVRGALVHVGPDVVIVDDVGATTAVPLAAIQLADGLDPALPWQPETSMERIGLAAVLRGWSDRRLLFQLRVGGAVSGSVRRVGVDHVDVLPDDTFAGLEIMRTVPFAGLAAVVDRSGLGF